VTTQHYSGGGDPARSLPLLWRDRKRPTRGPKPGLDVDRVVAAAIELADAEGLEALSMRRVAERLGVGTMSLYTYVPAKAELIDLMLDAVLAEEARPDGTAGWRAGLELRAREDWALFHRHPWILQISPARSLLGPNETDLWEATLGTVAGTGLRGAEMVLVVGLVADYTRGAAQTAVGAALAERRTGISDEQWWAAREPLFDKYFDPARYPTVTSVAAEGAFEQPAVDAAYTVAWARESFEFGLARVLDGIEAFIEGRADARPATARGRPAADDH
jgi:AcrR family transcriptional regulator